MPAVKTGFTPPPMPGMPAPMAPMGGMPPAPNPFAPMPPAPLAGMPPPPMPMPPMAQTAQGQPMMGSTAGRRRRFGDALEGMLGRNQGIGAVPQQPRPPMAMPQQRMVAPGTPMMRTPPMGSMMPRPMAMGGEVDIFGYGDGGPIQYYEEAGEVKKPSGVISRARDSEGNIVPGMFVAKYADGTYSAPVTASNIESLRQGLLKGTVTSGDYTADESANMAAKDVYLKSGDITVVDRDISGGFGNTLGMSSEMLGNDMVYMSFSDGSKLNAQKGMVDAMNEYGLLDNIQSSDDFNQMVNDISAASVFDPESDLAAASRLANDKIIAYNEALRASDPNIQKNIDTFRAYYAPQGQQSADDSDVSGVGSAGGSAASYPSVSADQIYGSEAGAGTAVGAGGNFGTGSYVADPVDVSEINPINYAQFQGDVGRFSGTPENFGLFGPSVSIPQSVSQYMTDPVTGGLTTSYGPQMASVSPIGGIKLPARPVSIDIFDWLSTPTYGTMYSRDPYSLEPEGLAMGGEVAGPFGGSVPRNTMIGDQPHMLAYINQDEEALLRSFGGSGISGPGGIPSYPPIGPSGYVSLDAIANEAVKSDPNVSFSHMGKTYDNVADFHEAVFGGDDDDDDEDYTPTSAELAEQLAAAGKDDKRSDVSVVDFTKTGSGEDYTSAAESDTDVSGAEFVSGPTIADLTDDDESGVNIFEPTLATDEVLPAPVVDTPVLYSDRRGNQFPTQAEADASDRAFAAQSALYGAGQEGFRRFAGIASGMTSDPEEDIRLAAKAYPSYLENFNEGREINIFDPAPFTYTNIGGIGGDTTGGGFLGITPAPITSSRLPSLVGDESGFLLSEADRLLEGAPIIDLNASVLSGRDFDADMDPIDRDRVTAEQIGGERVPSQVYESEIGGDRFYVGPSGDRAVGYRTGYGGSVILADRPDQYEIGRMGYDDDTGRYTLDGNILPSLGDSDAAAISAALQAGASPNTLLRNLFVLRNLFTRDNVLDDDDMGLPSDPVSDLQLGLGSADRQTYYGGSGPRDDRDMYQVPAESVISQTIKGFESRTETPYYDVNAYRAGFGSDTKTDPITGKVTKITEGTTVSKEEAEADLNRRLTTEFIPSVVNTIGADTFYSMNPQQQAALTSIAYNYGKLPDRVASVVNNVDSSTPEGQKAISDAIRSLEGDNEGVNRNRRNSEADLFLGQGKVPETSVVTKSDTGVTPKEIKSQISGDAEPTGLEAFFYDVIGNLGFGLGKGLADNLRNTSKENRQAIINQHVYALQNGATPKTDEEGNYIGFDISTMDTFADKVLAAEDITQFLPYGAEDADGDGVPDYERFGQVFDAQSVAAGADPYGMSTEQGFITSDGKEFFVDASGKVVEVTDGNVPYEVGGGQSVAEALGLTEVEDDDDSGTAKNYTMGPDGTIVCNDEGYVYNSETDMCEPPAEEKKSDTVSSPILSIEPYRSFEDIMASITTPAPKIAPISANIRPMQAGGMAGLNRAADNFLKALAG